MNNTLQRTFSVSNTNSLYNIGNRYNGSGDFSCNRHSNINSTVNGELFVPFIRERDSIGRLIIKPNDLNETENRTSGTNYDNALTTRRFSPVPNYNT